MHPSLAFLLFPVVLLSQRDTGTISGTVRDATGAVAPQVSITVTNVQTNFTFRTATGEAGNYVAPALRAGQYSIAAELTGFKKEVISGIVLQVNQVAVVDITLQVGSVAEVAEVTSTAPLLQTQNVTIGHAVTEKQVKELPLNGRNFVQLLTLTAGATPGISRTAQSSGGSLSSVRAPSAVQINGQSNLSTNYLLDGMDNMEASIGGLIIFPPVDAIQEFKVQTAASDTEFGSTGGGQVNVTLKSGTNAVHGNVFHYLRNEKLDAKNFFDNPASPIPPFKLNQFGFTLGGPLKRDRTFLFGDFEGSRIRQGQTFVQSVPTALMRTGDLTEIGRGMFDPLTYSAASNSRQQFPGNRIPAQRLSRAALNVIDLQYPLPSRPGIANNYVYNPIRPSNQDAFDVRLDHALTERDNFFLRYSFSDFDAGLTISPRPVLPNTLAGIDRARDTDPSTVRNHFVALSNTRAIRPNLINETRAGYTRYDQASTNRLLDIPVAERLGIRNLNRADLPFSFGLPQIGVSGFSTIGEITFLPYFNVINTYQFIDTLTFVAGRHTLKFGGDLRRRQFNYFQPPTQRGNFTFSGVFTNNPISPGNSGSGLGDFLLGLPANSSQEAKLNSLTGQRSTEFSGFVSDTWQATSRLTFTFGLRYELTTPRSEVGDRQSNFDTSVPGGAFRLASSSTIGRAMKRTDRNDFAPRLGIAYRLGNRAVLRSSYGFFYDITGSNRFQGTIFALIQNPPFTSGQNIVNSATQPTNRLEDGFPALAPVPVTNGLVGPNAVPGFTFAGRWQDPDTRTTYVGQWHVALEREIGANLVVDAAYVGSKTTKFFVNLGINDPVPGPGAVAPRRPFPGFANINGQANAGSASHHALQLTAKKRYSSGVNFLTSYTWGKTLGDFAGEGSKAQNFYDRSKERGRLNWDIRHRVVSSVNYELPFGKGKRFLSGASGPGARLAEGWSVGGIINLYSGEAATVGVATSTANTGLGSRADVVPGCKLRLDVRTPNRWFNTACFTTPPPFTYGNAGVGIVDGPGTKQFDLSLLKVTRVDEKRYFQLRLELFNAFNTPQFNVPATTLGAGAFGSIASAGVAVTFARTSRQMQLALKFFW
jgi:hypothetical protein